MKNHRIPLFFSFGLFLVASGKYLPSGSIPQGGETIDSMEGGAQPSYPETDPSESLEDGFGFVRSEPEAVKVSARLVSHPAAEARDNPSKRILVKHIPIIETIKIKKYKLVLAYERDEDCLSKKLRCIPIEEAELGSVVRTKPASTGPQKA